MLVIKLVKDTALGFQTLGVCLVLQEPLNIKGGLFPLFYLNINPLVQGGFFVYVNLSLTVTSCN